MAERRTNRRICIRFVGRVPDDPLRLLKEIDQAFRPQEIEISVENVFEEKQMPSLANEVLETKARQAVADALDDRDRKAIAKREEGDCDDHTDVAKGLEKRKALVTNCWRFVSVGWEFVCKLVPLLKHLNDLM